MKIREGLTYDDVLLVPKYSSIRSRDNVDVRAFVGETAYSHPIIPANMDSISGVEMCKAVSETGGLSILHRSMSYEDIATALKTPLHRCYFSIGLVDDLTPVFNIIKNHTVKGVCIDVAHGHHSRVINLISMIRKQYGGLSIIAGNVATADAARDLRHAGADIIKVGIGPGSLCTTRINTGCGVPQLTAIMDVREALGAGSSIIADGGIRYPGDITKALAAGASAVMVGALFAGTTEAATPSIYRGMASLSAQEDRKPGEQVQYVEGEVRAITTSRGSVKNVIEKLIAGLRSGMSYTGSRDLNELRENAEFVKISYAGFKESLPHGIL